MEHLLAQMEHLLVQIEHLLAQVNDLSAQMTTQVVLGRRLAPFFIFPMTSPIASLTPSYLPYVILPYMELKIDSPHISLWLGSFVIVLKYKPRKVDVDLASSKRR